ncbi:MAG: alpha-L-fucosidase [Saprospiraceae bacterium]
MKLTNLLCTLCLIILFAFCKKEGKFIPVSYFQQESSEVKLWKDNKLSMMVHFGLYSMLGGVYHGQQISKGYSEQIMAHAPIPADEYKSMASTFNPTGWNADSLANLAFEGGFRSIVITAKHHDGFNMYDTKESDFSITKSSPFKRDVLQELSEACSRSRLGFGVYYSLIDWNAKEGATPVSSHNADSISPALHQLNLRQIRELCSNYGSLTEIWFDMGTMTLNQSVEIRALVKSLQPTCMIGSRLGNGQGDFEVMGDNQLSSLKMECPWQAVASIYDNTWGYRSWQVVEDPTKKASTLLANLNKTLLKGGNYMLNVGPTGEGKVTEFEQKVIKKIGEWVNANGEAIYDIRPFPFGDKSWGAITFHPPTIYANVTSTPDAGKIILYGLNNNLTAAYPLGSPDKTLMAALNGPTVEFDLGMSALTFNPSSIFAIKYEGELNITPPKKITANATGKYELSYYNANVAWAQDGVNYYSSVPSVTNMNWDVVVPPKEVDYTITVYYTQQEKNKIINLKINDHVEQLDLSKYNTFRQVNPNPSVIPSSISTQGPFVGLDMNTHPGPIGYTTPTEQWGKIGTWTDVPNLEQGKYIPLHPDPMQTYYYLLNILSSAPATSILAFGTDDAFIAFLNGKLIYASGYPQEGNNTVFLDLPFGAESNTIILKHLNIKGDFKTFYSLKVDQIHFEKEVSFSKLVSKQVNHVEVSLGNRTHANENLGTPNLKIVIQEKKK